MSPEELESSRKVQTRMHALDAAFLVLAESGFEGLRTRRVAEVAGVNHASLHYHFSTKEALIQALVERILTRFAEIHSGESPSGSPLDRLLLHLKSVLHHMQREPAFYRTLLELELRAQRDAQVRTMLGKTHQAWRAHLMAILSDAEKRGCLNVASAERGADLVMAFLNGAALASTRKGLQDSAESLGRLLVNPDKGKE